VSVELIGQNGTALLTTFRRNGKGVGTPVGVRSAAGKVYFMTWTATGKVKRLANNPQATLAPCTRRGQVTGPTIHGTCQRLDGGDAERAKQIVCGNLIGRLWLLVYRLSRRQPVFFEVSPD
jgi:hypothetical protein